MEPYSPYIKKYQKEILAVGYSIVDNSQLKKLIDGYEVLITDLSVKNLLINVKTVLVWIKNTETKIIEKEIFIRNEILPLPFSKIESYVESAIGELKKKTCRRDVEEKDNTYVVNDLVQDANVRDITL